MPNQPCPCKYQYRGLRCSPHHHYQHNPTAPVQYPVHLHEVPINIIQAPATQGVPVRGQTHMGKPHVTAPSAFTPFVGATTPGLAPLHTTLDAFTVVLALPTAESVPRINPQGTADIVRNEVTGTGAEHDTCSFRWFTTHQAIRIPGVLQESVQLIRDIRGIGGPHARLLSLGVRPGVLHVTHEPWGFAGEHHGYHPSARHPRAPSAILH